MNMRFSPVLTADATKLSAVLESALGYRCCGGLQLTNDLWATLWVRGSDGLMLIPRIKSAGRGELIVINSPDCLFDQTRLKAHGLTLAGQVVYSTQGVHACLNDKQGRMIVVFEHRVYENASAS